MSTTTESTETTYTVTFERIGHHRDVASLVARVRDGDHLAEIVLRYARRFLFSGEVEVVLNVEKGLGLLVVGAFGYGGTFTFAPAPATPVELLRAAAEAAPHGPAREYYQRAAADHERNGGSCPAGGNCWFEQQARADLARASSAVAS